MKNIYLLASLTVISAQAYLVQEVVFEHPKTFQKITLYGDIHPENKDVDSKQSQLIESRIEKFVNNYQTIIYFEGYDVTQPTINIWNAPLNPITTIKKIAQTKKYDNIIPIDCRGMDSNLESALEYILVALPLSTNYQQLLGQLKSARKSPEESKIATDLILERLNHCNELIAGSSRGISKKLRLPAAEFTHQSRLMLINDVVDHIVDPVLRALKSQIDLSAQEISLSNALIGKSRASQLIAQRTKRFLSGEFSARSFFDKRGMSGESVYDFLNQVSTQISYIMDYNFLLHMFRDQKSNNVGFMGADHVYHVSQILLELGYTCTYNSRVTINGAKVDFTSSKAKERAGKFNVEYAPLEEFKSLLE